MSKIMVLANNSAGLYCFRADLLKELGQQHVVVASTPFDDNVHDLQGLDINLIETPMERRGMNPIHDLKLLLQYIRLLRKERPELVITYTIKPNVYGGIACRLLRISYAVNITGLGTAFQNHGMLRKLVTILYKVALKKAKVVFFENAENLQIFEDERIIKEQQATLLNGAGVNLEKFSVEDYPEDSCPTRFLFIGRVMAEKGVDELFAAMRKLREQGVQCTLDMLGGFDEDYESKIKAAEAEGWLKYHGYQSDVRPFIAKCHCFVLPSWHEGMANTNLECAASGRPIITSSIPGCREAVVEGVSGYTCEPKNAEALCETMQKFCSLSNEACKVMGLAGRAHMEEVFDKKKVVAATIAALQLSE